MVQPLLKTVWRFHTKLNTCLPYDSATKYLTKRNENMCPQEDVYEKVHSCIIYDREKLEIWDWLDPGMLNAWIWRAVNSYNSNKKEETMNTHSNTDYSQSVLC